MPIEPKEYNQHGSTTATTIARSFLGALVLTLVISMPLGMKLEQGLVLQWVLWLILIVIETVAARGPRR